MSQLIKVEHKEPLDLIFYDKQYTVLRRAKIIVLYNILNKHQKFTNICKQDKINLIQNIETPIWQYANEKAYEESTEPNEIYVAICYRIFANLDQEMIYNQHICAKVLDGSIDYKLLPRMSSQDLYPEMYTEILDRMNKIKDVERVIKTSALYQCRRCKENKCTIENVITRSIDEGVSVKITCINCSLSWIIS